MHKVIRRLFFLAILSCAFSCILAADEPARREWTVDGVVREALVYVPATAKTGATPVIFAFHGHGGTMASAMNGFSFQTLWPEALIVYMQGLNTPGKLTDLEGQKPGWQFNPGDHEDRDLKFFDAVLASLRQDYKVDEKRIYATGHSNGGGFTYVLWAARGGQFAAFAPASAPPTKGVLDQLKPKPAFFVAGQNDPIVKFERQQLAMDALRKLNECDEGQPWEGQQNCTVYPSKTGTPLVTFIHPGGHPLPPEAPADIVKFFKEHAKD